MSYLRKKWAELVNEKFAEKNLECRISEKTVDKQRKDLISEGKYEEAELLNRKPAPHLGSAYRNPKTLELIKERIKQVETDAECQTDTLGETIKNSSKMEKEILVFATDAAIRKVAREIQLERLRLEKEQAAERARYDADEILEEPLIVTVGNVYDHVETEIVKYKNVADEKLAVYKALKTKVLNDKQQNLAAKEKLFNGQYVQTIKEYAKTVRQLKAAKDDAAKLYGIKDKINELAAYSKIINELTDKRNTLGKKVNYYKKSIETDQKEKLAEILKDIKTENEKISIEAKTAYVEYSKAKKYVDKFAIVAEKLRVEDMDKVLFSDKLPSSLTRKCKINGKDSISKMQIMVFKGETYAILSSIPKEINDNMKENQITVDAVKIGDDIEHGKVPIYQLQAVKQQEKWKVISATVAIDKYADEKKTIPIHKKAYLYKTKNRQGNNTVRIKRHHPIVEQARQQQSKISAEKISKIAENLVDNGKDKNLHGRWNDEENIKNDKALNEEKRMYNGWSL